MIDIRKLKELVRLMVENELTEIDLRDQEETVTIKRGGDESAMMAPPQVMYGGAPVPQASAPAPASGGGEGAPAATGDEGLVAIESPMVGTYYSKPNPESDAFVSVGSSVSADTVVCLVEAMKVFNEIKSGQSGTVAKILVSDGDAVEFGQPLLMIKPG